MNIKLIFLTIFLCLIIFSCSSYVPVISVPIDSTALSIFSNKVNQRFTDYANTSGYNRIIDSINNRIVRGPTRGEQLIWYHAKLDYDKFVLFTFDKKDSCIIYSDSLKNLIYEVRPKLIAVPKGLYLLRMGGNPDSLINILKD